MSHLRAIYHLRRVLARSYAETELEFYSPSNLDLGFRDDFSSFGPNWTTAYNGPHSGRIGIDTLAPGSGSIVLGTAHWNDGGPIVLEVTTNDADGDEVLVDFKLL